MSKVHIIGSGFSSLSAASYLSKAGYEVVVLEKNKTLGGRARQFHKDGFTFDMGPTWYWMPDVFEKFFGDFNKEPTDFYQLEKLKPAYQVYFGIDDSITIPGSLEEIYEVFENEEKGSSEHLKDFLQVALDNYKVAIEDLVYKPGESPFELVNFETITKVNRFLSTIRKEVRKKIKSSKLIQILEFPVLFLGAKPDTTPAFYSFMNYADFGLGTWHPVGGMYKVVEAMVDLAKEQGVTFKTSANVEKIHVHDGTFTGLTVNNEFIKSDLVLSGADYHHTETLLEDKYRQYSEKYWDKKVFAPSSLLFYVGFNSHIEKVEHHTLFFDTDFDVHAKTIYDNPSWPSKPLFYASFPSKTDASFTPNSSGEAGVFLIPLAPGIEDNQELRDKYFDIIINRLEKLTGKSIKKNIIFNESFCINDFVKDYNSYKGNAYGLANTLMQTAFLRPKLKSKKVKNLFFTGQLTVPGPGVPPSLISGKIVSELIKKYHPNYETVI